MEIKKIKKSEDGMNWLSLVLDNIFSPIETFVRGTVETFHGAAHKFTTEIMRKAFLLSFPVLGVFFLFSGLGEMMSVVYNKPGLGEIIMGFFTLLLSLVVYVFHKK